MEKTPEGTSVGVDDPYEHAGVCDHLTDDGRCRYAFEHPEQDPAFARERREDDLRCPVVADDPETGNPDTAGSDTNDWEWKDCPHFRSRTRNRKCQRCGLAEKRMAHDDERPLLEEHHLSYSAAGETLSHEITVYLCRWCHSKVHDSWARIDDDVNPDPEAIAAKESRVVREQREMGFETARERWGDERDG